MNDYVDSKFRIIQNQNENDIFIYSADDAVIQQELKKRKIVPSAIPFSLAKPASPGAGIDGEKMIINFNQKQFSMSILDLSLQGKHNTYNSMAAGIASMVFEIRNEQLRESLADFKGVEHRLEQFIKVHGIEFINDSKATNVNSTWYALECMTTPTIWIVGGVDKGNDYTELMDLVQSKVKAIVCLGTDCTKLQETFAPVIEKFTTATSMKEAVNKAYRYGNKGDSVLLSPACASFDLFKNYEDRGHQFKECVREL
jgi:UDP-N-acetylmuramoylalanine--D-glutamate ligase